MNSRCPRRLSCNDETYALVVKDCVDLYRQEHPELSDIQITHNFILRRIAEFYLEDH